MSSLDYNYIADLVPRAQSGDSDAFAELYAATYQRQYHFAYRYLNNEHLAQDALSEVYILTLENLTKLKEPSLVIAWLNQINFRVCYNLQKKQLRYNTEIINFNDEVEHVSSSCNPSAADSNPEDLVIKADSQEYIMNQILKLPFTEAQVIILKYYQNMKHEEISRLMDISRSSVNRYLASGRKRLANIIQL